MENSLKLKYKNEVVPALMKQFNYSSIMQVPRLEKIVINMTNSGNYANPKGIANVEADLMQITGQKPVQTFAKKSLASFKLREGMPIGAKVTLRRDKMWDLLLKLIHVVLPRVRDFRGTSVKSFDQQGNYAIGIKEQIIFPEIEFDKVDRMRGLDIIIVTSAKTAAETKAVLELLGMPFKKGGN